MSKLYTIRVSYDYVVVANSEQEAESVGRSYLRDALYDISSYDVDLDVEEGVHAAGWYDECIPYGGDGNTCTSDYLKG